MAEPEKITEVDARPPVGAPRTGDARWARWPVVLVLAWALLAVADLAFFHAGLVSGHATAKSAAPSLAWHGHTVTGVRPKVRAPGQPAAPARVLTPVSAAAFGPGGAAQGDDPQNARLALAGDPATPWHSSWYTTAHFGNLQTGTGLLIDMGRPVQINRVTILLDSARGADLQVLTGKVPDLTRLRPQASASDAGGRVRLKLARPERARYLLVWFTVLPPDSSGTFQVSVYNIRILGRR